MDDRWSPKEYYKNTLDQISQRQNQQRVNNRRRRNRNNRIGAQGKSCTNRNIGNAHEMEEQSSSECNASNNDNISNYEEEKKSPFDEQFNSNPWNKEHSPPDVMYSGENIDFNEEQAPLITDESNLTEISKFNTIYSPLNQK